MSKFNEMIKKYREDNNLTQQDFADKLHVSRQAVSKWETGNSYPNYDLLKEIANVLNTTVDNLLSKEEIVKETITVKNKNKRNLIMIISSAIIAVIAIIVGISAIIISNNKKEIEVIPEIVEESNIKYLGFFMRCEDFDEEAPTVENYNNKVYPGIYLLNDNGWYFENYVKCSSLNHHTDIVHNDSENKVTYTEEFSLIANEKLLNCYYAYENLDTNEIYFEETNHRTLLQKMCSSIRFKEKNIVKEASEEKEYIYDITIKFYEDVKETKIIEYNNEFKKVKETIVNYDEFDNYLDYKVSDECLYVVIEDQFEESLEKRMIWREDFDKKVLLYRSEDNSFHRFLYLEK